LKSALDPWRLGWDVIELLFSACGAEAVGTPLTEEEKNARTACEQSLRQQCHMNGIPYLVRIDHRSYLQHVKIVLLGYYSGQENLKLTQAAFRAREDDRTLSEGESAGLLAVQEAGRGVDRLFRGDSKEITMRLKRVEQIFPENPAQGVPTHK
jgi:hypothetical protein